jgi:hypothetical protein
MRRSGIPKKRRSERVSITVETGCSPARPGISPRIEFEGMSRRSHSENATARARRIGEGYDGSVVAFSC